MFNNTALDVFIGLVFIFLLYSLLATILQEIIATKLSFRSKVLEKAILRMLEDGKTTSRSGIWDRIKAFGQLIGKPNMLKGKSIAPWFYVHPLIKYLGEDNTFSKPAYISPQNFSKVMIDLLKGFGRIDTNEAQTINDSINNETIFKIPINIETDKGNPAVKAIIHQQGGDTIINASDTVKINMDTSLFLKSLWLESGADVEKFRGKLEGWFNDTMDRCSGWYKRYNQAVLFVVGLIIAIGFNIDTIAIQRVLSKDDTAREQIVQMAISKQQQYGEIINSLDSTKKADSARTDVMNSADTLYKQTYQMLSNDANAAGTVLGLGRPWGDTIKMIKDSSCRVSKLQGLEKEISLTNIHIDSLNSNLNKARQDTAALLNATRKKAPTKARTKQHAPLNFDTAKFNADIANIQSLQSGLKGSTAERKSLQHTYDSINFIQQRCAYIQKYKEGKWFVYAPNQAGGWETLFGWIITALAICLGAPFWFDLLNKLISLRGVGTKIDTSGSNDKSSGGTTSTAGGNTQPAPIIVNTNQSEEAVG